jgi:hypothetical protein
VEHDETTDCTELLQQGDNPANGDLTPASAQDKSAAHDSELTAAGAEVTANGRAGSVQDGDPLQALASEVEAAVLHVDSPSDAQVPELTK